MTILFDATRLSSAANRLSANPKGYASAVAEPPGADPTSASAVAQLNGVSAALSTLLAHGSALREVGAVALAGTATLLQAQDDANARAISAGAAPQRVCGPPPLPSLPSPDVPSIPEVPAALTPLPGEAHSHALYGGPGSASLHTFADHWEQTAEQLRESAASTMLAGEAIDASWQDGQQRAGANTRRHGEWLTDMSEHASILAAHARTVAQSFEAAKRNTPSPQEFAQARQQLQQAMSRFAASRGANVVEVQQKNQDLAHKQAEATAAAADYHSSIAGGTLSGLSSQIKTAPPIAGGSNMVHALDAPLSPPPEPKPYFDPRNPFVGDERFGQWVNVVPPPYTGDTPPAPWTGHRSMEGFPGKEPAGPSGFYVPGGKTWIDDSAPPMANLQEQYRFRISGQDFTSFTRMVNGHQQQWVQYTYEAQRFTQLNIAGPAWASTEPDEIARTPGGVMTGGLGGITPPPKIGGWEPISLPQIAVLSDANPSVTYYIPNGCGGQFTFANGMPAGIQPPPIIPRMIAGG